MADEAKPKVEADELDETGGETSAEKIEKAPKRRARRTVEERVAWLEDENSNLREKNSGLEKTLNEICESLKTKPSESKPGKSLLDDLSDFFNW